MLDKKHVDSLERLVESIRKYGNKTRTLTAERLRNDIPDIDPGHVLRYMRLVDEFESYAPVGRPRCKDLYCEW